MIDPGPAAQTMGGFKGRRNAQGRYVALGGGAAPVPDGLSITGAVAHGSVVTITDSEGRLEAYGRVRHWEHGSDVELLGEQKAPAGIGVIESTEDLNDLWSGLYGTPLVVDTDLRHPRVDRQYKAKSTGGLQSPAAFGGQFTRQDTHIIRFSYWAWVTVNFFRTNTYKITSQTGAFDNEGDGLLVESVAVYDSADDYLFDVTLVGIATVGSDSYATIESFGSGANVGSGMIPVGGRIVGKESGSEAAIGEKEDNTWSFKHMRTDQPDAGSGEKSVRVTITNAVGGGILVRGDTESESSFIRQTDYGGGVFGNLHRQWVFSEFFMDFSNPESVGTTLYANGQKISEVRNVDVTPVINLESRFRPSQTLIDASGADTDKLIADMLMSEVSIDNTLVAWYVTDAAVWEESTHWEIQKSLTGSPDASEIQLNQGAFDSLNGKYLHQVAGLDRTAVVQGIPLNA